MAKNREVYCSQNLEATLDLHQVCDRSSASYIDIQKNSPLNDANNMGFNALIYDKDMTKNTAQIIFTWFAWLLAND